MQVWWPAFQNVNVALSPELRTKLWDNVGLLTTKEITPQEYVELNELDWAEYF